MVITDRAERGQFIKPPLQQIERHGIGNFIVFVAVAAGEIARRIGMTCASTGWFDDTSRV